jgi:hypothetical protein
MALTLLMGVANLGLKGILFSADEKPMNRIGRGSYSPLMYARFQTNQAHFSSNIFILAVRSKSEAPRAVRLGSLIAAVVAWAEMRHWVALAQSFLGRLRKSSSSWSSSAAICLGNTKKKALPSPSALSAQILPPWYSTMCLLMVRPSPVPR